MRLLRTACANSRIARLEAVWASATLVRWALAILVALYAYRIGGVGSVGAVAAARMVPAALVAPRLAVIADQRSRRAVLIVSLVLRLGFAGALWATVAAGGSLLLLLVLAALYGMADSLQRPTLAALLGVHARNPTELAAANTLWSIIDNAAFLVGSLLVGVLVSLAGLSVAFAACTLPLAVATLIAFGLPRDTPPPAFEEFRARDELLAGVRAIAHDRQLRLLVGVLGADWFVQALLDVLLVVIALGVLDIGEQGVGWLSAAWGAGGVLGGAAAAMLLARRRLALGAIAGLLLAGLPLVVLAVSPGQWTATVVMVLVGIGFGIIEVALLIFTQRLTHVDLLARVYGAQETVTIMAMAIGSVAASVLVLALGQRGALAATGLLLPLLAVVLASRIRLLDTGPRASDEDFELLRGLPPFATLSVATIENLAIRSHRRVVLAGEDAVTQGELATSFYVIAEGDVDVFEDGDYRRHQGAGDFFGEIALMRDTVRTATVRATTDLDLLVLDRAEFLAAISAHLRTMRGLSEIAAVRLSDRA